jgi:sugar phosphate isomerase/epimerase
MTHDVSTRREFMQTTGAAALAFAAGAHTASHAEEKAMKRDYKISLAQWSLHRQMGRKEGLKDTLEFPKIARQEFDIEGIELVNQQMNRVMAALELGAEQKNYLDALMKNAADNKVRILLVMVDGMGDVGAPKEEFRAQAVKKHKFWLEVCAYLGCHSMRMNWGGAPKDFLTNAEGLRQFTEWSVPGFRALADYGAERNINVIIENHWGPSSYIEPLTNLMKAVNHPRFGTLPDFGNFPEEVDKYAAVDAFMPYAKAVSAKCHDFDDVTGLETRIDFERMIQIVHDKHGYHGFIGIEYEGDRLEEFEGIRRCNELLKKLRG